MTTLLAVRAPAFGTIRCDRRCHQAKGRRCNCVCDGLYHGLGDGSSYLVDAVAIWQPRLLALYAEDAVLHPPNGPAVRGRAGRASPHRRRARARLCPDAT